MCQKDVRRGMLRRAASTNRIKPRGSSSYIQSQPDDPGYRPKVVVQLSIRNVGSSRRLRESDDDPTASSLFSISSKAIGIIATQSPPHTLDEIFNVRAAVCPIGRVGTRAINANTTALAHHQTSPDHPFQKNEAADIVDDIATSQHMKQPSSADSLRQATSIVDPQHQLASQCDVDIVFGATRYMIRSVNAYLPIVIRFYHGGNFYRLISVTLPKSKCLVTRAGQLSLQCRSLPYPSPGLGIICLHFFTT